MVVFPSTIKKTIYQAKFSGVSVCFSCLPHYFQMCNHLGEWLFFEKRADILPLNGGHQIMQDNLGGRWDVVAMLVYPARTAYLSETSCAIFILYSALTGAGANQEWERITRGYIQPPRNLWIKCVNMELDACCYGVQ